ncbi:hypothetical protein R1flu_005144 [Riccia fluitans]|uniref:Uncharacterized protein n=1 Tax=Riccia fluitans TaxID=41844 RepID=A0ABD1YSB2_9MARC
MEKVMNLIKPKPTVQEQLRDWQRKLQQEARNIDRQIHEDFFDRRRRGGRDGSPACTSSQPLESGGVNSRVICWRVCGEDRISPIIVFISLQRLLKCLTKDLFLKLYDLSQARL